ncbi:MAG: phasin family protein [Usitatibacter sp.]
MVTRKTRQGPYGADSDTAKAVADSAQKIWLAGLGAFERAKAEGPKVFEMLVEQGRGFAERAQSAAGEALRNVREGAGEAGGRFDKFEQAVEERLARSVGRLGLLTRGEVDELSKQVRDLADSVHEMMARGGVAAKEAPRARRAPPKASAGSKTKRAKDGNRAAPAKARRKAKRAPGSRKRS